MPTSSTLQNTPAHQFYAKAHVARTAVIFCRELGMDTLGPIASLPLSTITTLRRHPFLSMPLITDEYKMAYKIYIRTIDWGNSFEFTPDVRPDKEMLGARKWSWRLYVVMGTRAVMEGLLNARADALNLEEERLGRMVAGGDDGEEDI